jgi:hypothetical protein
MCQPSIVTDDWVKKGLHIRVEGIELSVAPDHLGGVVFKSSFSLATSSRARKNKIERAIRTARTKCLPLVRIRRHWIREARHAMVYMLSYNGVLASLANGRMLEFKFLILALERY